jgi:excisionase family DNA binding protein
VTADLKPLLTPTEVAIILAVHRTTVLNMIRRGTLPAVRVTSGRVRTTHRIRRADLIDYIRAEHR